MYLLYLCHYSFLKCGSFRWLFTVLQCTLLSYLQFLNFIEHVKYILFAVCSQCMPLHFCVYMQYVYIYTCTCVHQFTHTFSTLLLHLHTAISPFMEFTPLPANYNKNPSDHPYLLETMERNQFKHSTNSHFHQYSAKPYSFKQKFHKKPTLGNAHNAIPFYQGTRYRKSSNTKPSIITYQRRANLQNCDNPDFSKYFIL